MAPDARRRRVPRPALDLAGRRGRFDALTALHHPVGGVLHAIPGTPTVVARDGLDPARLNARWWLHERKAHRLDLVPSPRSAADVSLNVVLLSRPLRYGVGSTLAGLCAAVAGLDRQEITLPGCRRRLVRQQRAKSERFVYLLARNAAHNPPCSPLYFVLAVACANDGPADLDRHLICGRMAPAAASQLRDAARTRGALLTPTMDDIAPESPIKWCTVSEERAAVLTRRDSRRPASAYLGLHVVLWGCGGIGSWVGEFLARAGAARITLCDPATITGGLLVRRTTSRTTSGPASPTRSPGASP